MRRLAVFVEGQTELRFVQRLIEEVAGKSNVAIQTQRIIGGSTVPRQTLIIQAGSNTGTERFYVLICDCGGDHQVKTRVLEEHAGLTRAGYSRIIGIRDVKPTFSISDIPRLERGLRTGVQAALIPVDFILCVLEIEAWFVAETTHFTKIDKRITIKEIKKSLGFDPEVDDLTQRQNPAIDLNACYQLAGRTYKKGADETIAALDYSEIFITLPARIPYLNRLTFLLDDFLRSPQATV